MGFSHGGKRKCRLACPERDPPVPARNTRTAGVSARQERTVTTEQRKPIKRSLFTIRPQTNNTILHLFERLRRRRVRMDSDRLLRPGVAPESAGRSKDNTMF